MKQTINDQTVLLHNPRWRRVSVDTDLVLFDEIERHSRHLNETAALIWRLLDGQRSVGEVIELLQAAYPDNPDLALDVRASCQALMDDYLVFQVL